MPLPAAGLLGPLSPELLKPPVPRQPPAVERRRASSAIATLQALKRATCSDIPVPRYMSSTVNSHPGSKCLGGGGARGTRVYPKNRNKTKNKNSPPRSLHRVATPTQVLAGRAWRAGGRGPPNIPRVGHCPPGHARVRHDMHAHVGRWVRHLSVPGRSVRRDVGESAAVSLSMPRCMWNLFAGICHRRQQVREKRDGFGWGS